MSVRRRRRSPLRRFWVAAAILLVPAAAAGFLAARWPGFDPRHVAVTGNRIVSSSEILARAAIDPSVNVWFQNTAAMASRVDSIPFVATATVYRRFPARVTIAVSERVPFANVRSGREAALVDRSLRVLEMGQRSALPTLVLDSSVALLPGATLHRRSALALRNVLLALRAHDLDARALRLSDGEVSVLLQGNVRVLLGDEASAAAAVPLVEPILTRFALLGRPVKSLDLRSPVTPVVTESASKQLPPGKTRAKASPAR